MCRSTILFKCKRPATSHILRYKAYRSEANAQLAAVFARANVNRACASFGNPDLHKLR